MRDDSITYEQLLETNFLLQQKTDITYHLAMTRTAQDSKLFPVSAYIGYSYVLAFYRYPALLRKIETAMSAEELGDRARRMSGAAGALTVGYCMPDFYQCGRQWLIDMGMIRPTDAIGDLIYVMDFWKRFQLAYHREDGHLTNANFGQRSQVRPERSIQVFEADLYECENGDDLQVAATDFMSTASAYCFLIACESRISLHNEGPYMMSDGRHLLVRDFLNMAEGDYPWLDDVAADVPYNHLTVTVAFNDAKVYITDDWGSFETEPTFQAHHVGAVGLYTSDALSDGFVPVGMGSREELTRTFRDLTDACRKASDALWLRIAGWSRDEMIDAGAHVYFGVFKELAHIAGVYDHDDWMLGDERAHRFRELLNDDYARSLVVSVCIGATDSATLSPDRMMKEADTPTRLFSAIPLSVLSDDEYTLTVGNMRPGHSSLAPKNGRWRTTQGVLTLDDYNEQSRNFTPLSQTEENRYLCEQWVKYHPNENRARQLYAQEQRNSRNFRGRGSGAGHGDVAIARSGGVGSELSSFEALHGLAIIGKGSTSHVAELLGAPLDQVAKQLATAVATGSAAVVNGEYLLLPLAQLSTRTDATRHLGHLRNNVDFVAAYEDFERLNVKLKAIMTSWQVREVGGHSMANDHSDSAYDNKVMEQLGRLHDKAVTIIEQLSAPLSRMGAYLNRLDHAIDRTDQGDGSWVSDVQKASYHTVWFQLHEDLLRIMNRTRSE